MYWVGMKVTQKMDTHQGHIFKAHTTQRAPINACISHARRLVFADLPSPQMVTAWCPVATGVCVCVSECVAIPLMRHTRCDNERYVRDLRLAASAAEAECENTQTDTPFKLQDDTHTPYVWVCRTFNADFLPLPTPVVPSRPHGRRPWGKHALNGRTRSRIASLNAVLERCTRAEINDDDHRFWRRRRRR